METEIFNGYSFNVINRIISELKSLIISNNIHTPGKASLSERAEFLVGHLHNCTCSKLEVGDFQNDSFKFCHLSKIEKLIDYAEKNILEL